MRSHRRHAPLSADRRVSSQIIAPDSVKHQCYGNTFDGIAHLLRHGASALKTRCLGTKCLMENCLSRDCSDVSLRIGNAGVPLSANECVGEADAWLAAPLTAREL
jgi:hypothetical protein